MKRTEARRGWGCGGGRGRSWGRGRLGRGCRDGGNGEALAGGIGAGMHWKGGGGYSHPLLQDYKLIAQPLSP